MKQFIGVLFFISISFFSVCQEKSWTQEELNVLEKYGLDKQDHRGVEIVYEGCESYFDSEILGFEAFYSSSDRKKDITKICVKDNGVRLVDNGTLLSVHESISLYLLFKKE